MTTPFPTGHSFLPVIAWESAAAHDASLGFAAVVTLLGMWLCWRAADVRMALEERVKDGDLSADDASRKIRRSMWIGPAVTIIGIALLLFSILD